jgi:pyruvate formate lyase activating enzyme
MQIKGFEKTSLVDWDGKIVSVIFLPKCNFRCGFCHGASLVLDWQELPDIAIRDIMDFLVSKKGWIDGVCITGGEPTLQKKGLKDLLKIIKNLGFLTKLDTNGTTPDFISQLIKEKLVDYIAVDIKASKDKYKEAVRVKVDLDKINKTIKLLLKGKVDYEFRTTVVPGIIDECEIKKIGKWIKGAKRYALQQFRAMDTLDKKFLKVKPYPKEKLEEFVELLKGKVKNCRIRGA